ncbi:MAG: Fic family protein, partial [Spirochaetaceae bacterium]|nr:Fic family protein [Spirochaetaceae bacterium]
MNLEVLAAFFRKRKDEDIIGLVRTAPTSRYVRIAWFLYEWLLDRRLDLPDLEQGNYLPVLDPELFYALPEGAAAHRVRRQRVIDNLPGTREWCPMLRRTDALRRFEDSRLDLRLAEKMARYPESLLTRASQFLYSKETKSSWAIEKLTADARRTARFVELLRMSGTLELRSEAALVRLQNAIVDERYAAEGFRTSQNYVGQSLGSGREWIQYVPPRPEDLPSLMAGWMESWAEMEKYALHPVALAAAIGFGFVFLHPFDDGNGRLHRFILH